MPQKFWLWLKNNLFDYRKMTSDFRRSIAFAVLILFNFLTLDWHILSAALFAGWWFFSAGLAEKYLSVIWPTLDKIFIRVLGAFTSLMMLGWLLSFIVSFLVYNDWSVSLSLIIVSMIQRLIGQKIYPSGNNDQVMGDESFHDVLPYSEKMFYGFFGLALMALGLIFLSVKSGYLLSPWQTLNYWYVAVIFLLAVNLMYAIFSVRKDKLVVILIILFSFVLHSYLLVYGAGFGGDRFRHLGSEYRLLDGIEGSLSEKWSRTTNLFSLAVPANLVNGSQLSYGFNWSISAVMSRLSGIDVFYLDQILMIFFWSIFLTIIFYAAAKTLGTSSRVARLTAAMPLFLYILQYYGSLALPASYGALIAVFMLAYWLAYLKDKRRDLLVLGLALTIASIFSYSLTFIILLIMAALVLAIDNKKKLIIVAAFSSVLIFLTELMSPYSSLVAQLFNFTGFKNLIQANIFFFVHSPHPAISIFDNYHAYLAFSILMLILLLAAIIRFIKVGDQGRTLVLSLLIILLVNYKLGWLFLDGLNVLPRRLDVFIALLCLLPLAFFIGETTSQFKKRGLRILAVCLSLWLILSYISGPQLDANVTVDENAAMKKTAQEIGRDYPKYCVLADTWPLLALDAYTLREMAAGNFPETANHQQDRRVWLFDQISLYPSAELLLIAKQTTGADKCFLMLNSEKTPPTTIDWLNSHLGQAEVFGQEKLWRF